VAIRRSRPTRRTRPSQPDSAEASRYAFASPSDARDSHRVRAWRAASSKGRRVLVRQSADRRLALVLQQVCCTPTRALAEGFLSIEHVDVSKAELGPRLQVDRPDLADATTRRSSTTKRRARILARSMRKNRRPRRSWPPRILEAAVFVAGDRLMERAVAREPATRARKPQPMAAAKAAPPAEEAPRSPRVALKERKVVRRAAKSE